MKILIKVNKKEDLIYPADGYIFGVKDFSYLFRNTFTYEEILKIKKESNKEIYASFNKIIFNSELEEYKSKLKLFDEMGLEGIFVGDIAALTYNLKTNIILDQMHLNNSYLTVRHYENNKVKGIMINNDITLEDINLIKEKTNIFLYKQVFGYPHLSTSKRYLVKNYLDTFNVITNSKTFSISENNNDYYKVYEDSFGTHILGCKVLNLLGTDINIDYGIIDGLMLDDISIVVDSFLNKKIENKDLIDSKYNCDTGFINKKTIYKVKKDEK